MKGELQAQDCIPPQAARLVRDKTRISCKGNGYRLGTIEASKDTDAESIIIVAKRAHMYIHEQDKGGGVRV